MRFNEFNEGIDPSAKAAIKGMRELSGDQYYGLYKTMKDVAGHDGEKQTSPEGDTDHEVSDKPFAYAYTDEEKNMIKGVDPKAKQITSDKSEEIKEDVNFMPAGEYKNYPLEVRKTKFNDKFFIAQAQIGREIVKTKGDTQDQAVAALKQQIDDKSATALSKASQTENQTKRLYLSSSFCRGMLGKQTKDPFYIKLDNQMLYVSEEPAPGFVQVKNYKLASGEYGWGFGIDINGKFVTNGGLVPGARYAIAHNRNSDSEFASFKLTLDSYITSSSDKNTNPNPLLIIQNTGRSAQTEGSLDEAGGTRKNIPSGTTGIHIVQYSEENRPKPVDKVNHIYSTGNWAIDFDVAKTLIGKNIYLHETKDKPSFHGGQIIDVKPAERDAAIIPGVTFIYKMSTNYRGVKWPAGKDVSSREYIAFDVPENEMVEAGNNYHANRTGFARPSGQRDDERHDLDAPRPTIYALKINGKIWQKDGNTVTFFTRERALAARNSILAKRPDIEVGLVQRPQD